MNITNNLTTLFNVFVTENGNIYVDLSFTLYVADCTNDRIQRLRVNLQMVLREICKNQWLCDILTELHRQMTYGNSENLILNPRRFSIDLDGNTINYWMHLIEYALANKTKSTCSCRIFVAFKYFVSYKIEQQ
ncbi:unnamed protein product [Adineta ricciae]|uniref:Uncharacterized protein n=1 Tax=Adineta ricciae TaxID=249248 RepID=A0A814PA44_ADIRI|nr:unnamed protein product [Adineta ricciae]